jgi:hypothetical protein
MAGNERLDFTDAGIQAVEGLKERLTIETFSVDHAIELERHGEGRLLDRHGDPACRTEPRELEGVGLHQVGVPPPDLHQIPNPEPGVFSTLGDVTQVVASAFDVVIQLQGVVGEEPGESQAGFPGDIPKDPPVANVCDALR